MHAFKAAKRTTVFLLSLLIVLSASLALAHDDNSGWLGVTLQELSPSMAKALQLDDESGVLVNDVIDESPAQQAGIEDGDVILSFAGHDTEDTADLITAVQDTKPGDEVKVEVLRNGKKVVLDVTVGEHEDRAIVLRSFGGQGSGQHGFTWVDEDDVNVKVSGDQHFENVFITRAAEVNRDRGFLGIHLDDLNEQLGDYFGVEDGKGALVTTVVEDSPAERAGLQAGDVIVMIDGDAVESSAELHKAMSGTKPDDALPIQVIRKGASRELTVTLGEVPEDQFSKHIEILGESGDFTFRAPKMLWHHGGGSEYRVHRNATPDHVEVFEFESSKKEMDELRGEFKELQKELQELKKELKK